MPMEVTTVAHQQTMFHRDVPVNIRVLTDGKGTFLLETAGDQRSNVESFATVESALLQCYLEGLTDTKRKDDESRLTVLDATRPGLLGTFHILAKAKGEWWLFPPRSHYAAKYRSYKECLEGVKLAGWEVKKEIKL